MGLASSSRARAALQPPPPLVPRPFPALLGHVVAFEARARPPRPWLADPTYSGSDIAYSYLSSCDLNDLGGRWSHRALQRKNLKSPTTAAVGICFQSDQSCVLLVVSVLCGQEKELYRVESEV